MKEAVPEWHRFVYGEESLQVSNVPLWRAFACYKDTIRRKSYPYGAVWHVIRIRLGENHTLMERYRESSPGYCVKLTASNLNQTLSFFCETSMVSFLHLREGMSNGFQFDIPSRRCNHP